ncbi:hypothetical protein [Tautonia sociabilis]|uniref:Uncharacterized protein n=1 Tax=Tautonia sociabilis TaxID=2080755 RepID=A0A432MEE7_9BACT|nr:hypothetical protein [Tautonia sociabilis]RUL83671.1 hypothetical protein TsocGM_21810 [Tautonia sociabilis]
MIRLGWLGILAAALAPGVASAQFGGGGGGGSPLGRAGKAFTVEVEVAGGKKVVGPMAIAPVEVRCDFGRYAIRPEKIRTIRLEADPAQAPPRDGSGGVLIPGAVVATSGEEVAGVVTVPQGWAIETDLGTLTLDPTKVTSITLVPEPISAARPAAPRPEETPAGAGAGAGVGADRAAVMQIGRAFWAISAAGDRVAVRHPESGETRAIDLPASAEKPLKVVPVSGVNLAALQVEGAEVGRIAVFDFRRGGRWHAMDLREPVAGIAAPIVNTSVVAYDLGRFIYAFGAEAGRWGVLELPEGAEAVAPVVGADSVVVRLPDRIHTFSSSRGEWTSTGPAELLGPAVGAGGVGTPR